MNEAPFFSVLLPAKGRPELVRDALLSVLEQSYTDFELIVSNNGADPMVRDAIAGKLDDPRIRYLEQPQVLPMPEHWETLSRLASGQYLTVLPDRSVLKQGALAKIADIHQNGGSEAVIITWPWDLYYESGFLLPYTGIDATTKVLDSVTLALESLQIRASYPMALPRGLNSSVSLDLIRKIRDLNGNAFSTINPDFSFAYNCLMCHPQVTHIGEALMISQGLSVSNGGNAYVTDASAYVSTLSLEEPICHSPIKALFVENIIAEDFFAACHRFDRQDVLQRFDISNLYQRCFMELDEKRAARILSLQALAKLEQSLEEALSKEPAPISSRVNIQRKQPINFKTRMRRILKKQFGRYIKKIQPFLLRLKGGKRFKSVLVASGHRSA